MNVKGIMPRAACLPLTGQNLSFAGPFFTLETHGFWKTCCTRAVTRGLQIKTILEI
jgi:hypothetical protein